MPMQSLAISNYDRNAAILDTVWYDARDYGTSCALGGNSTPLDGNDNPERIFLYLIGKGLSAEQAAGVMGNFQQESTFDPASIQGDPPTFAGPDYIPVHGVGFGLAQWTWTDRQAPLQQMARDTNRKIINLSLQLDYVWHELSGTWINALNNLKAETTPERAAYVFHRDYEGSKDTEADVIRVRGGNARELYEKYKDMAPGSGTPLITTDCKSIESPTGGLSDFLGGDFTIYNQCSYAPFGGPWGNLMTPYGQTMCSAACGPTSLAMVAINMTGAKITPLETINYYTANNHWYSGGGSLISAIPASADAFGLRSESINKGDINAYREVFAKGGMVIVASRGTSPFLSQGHAIVLRGINSENKFVIADPGYKETNISPANEFSIDKILTDVRNDGYSAAFAFYKK